MKNQQQNSTGTWQAFTNFINDIYWPNAINDLPRDQVSFMFNDFKNTYGMNEGR